ncbi:MAG TPA: hypothetical protein VJJ81_02295 [Candidatus Babeliales bacterium]|nr:hypothetical protein [Candidatus Babeliales bacterium]
MKKLLSILALSSLVVGNVFAINRTGGNIGPGGVQPVCDFGTIWCPVKNACVAINDFSIKGCFSKTNIIKPNTKKGPNGQRTCPLYGQLYCARNKKCLALGANQHNVSKLQAWCNAQPN